MHWWNPPQMTHPIQNCFWNWCDPLLSYETWHFLHYLLCDGQLCGMVFLKLLDEMKSGGELGLLPLFLNLDVTGGSEDVEYMPICQNIQIGALRSGLLQESSWFIWPWSHRRIRLLGGILDHCCLVAAMVGTCGAFENPLDLCLHSQITCEIWHANSRDLQCHHNKPTF